MARRFSPVTDLTPQDAAPVRLQISSERRDSASVMTLSGELDIASAPSLEHAMQDVMHSAPGRVVIDLAGVTFMDSTGLRALLMARERATGNGQELRLRPGPRQVQRVFELSGTLDTFTFEQ
jgi:anti-sigma B factor antagonist